MKTPGSEASCRQKLIDGAHSTEKMNYHGSFEGTCGFTSLTGLFFSTLIFFNNLAYTKYTLSEMSSGEEYRQVWPCTLNIINNHPVQLCKTRPHPQICQHSQIPWRNNNTEPQMEHSYRNCQDKSKPRESPIQGDRSGNERNGE